MDKREFINLKKKVFEKYFQYEKKISINEDSNYKNDKHFFNELNDKQSKQLKKYFIDLNKNFKKINHNYKSIDKKYLFNALYFSKNLKHLKLQKLLTNYYYPKNQKIKNNLKKFITKNIIKECEKILGSKISIINCIVEISNSKNIKEFSQIINESSKLKSQTNFTWHRDGFPRVFKKILIYPFNLSRSTGTISLKKTLNSKSKTLTSTNSSFLLFDNSKIWHKGILPKRKNLLRPLIQMTIIPVKSNRKFFFETIKNRLYPIDSPKI